MPINKTIINALSYDMLANCKPRTVKELLTTILTFRLYEHTNMPHLAAL